MQDNQRMLLEMGLLSAASLASAGNRTTVRSNHAPAARKRQARSKAVAPSTFVRRSSRRIPGGGADDMSAAATEAPPAAEEDIPPEEAVPQVGTAFPSFSGGSRAQFASQSHLRESGAALGARLLCGHGHNV